ncbi:MAG TPA: arylesterase [Opitutaceae bacterium]|nr:arylesterase [Opitutaceae bacterium]
MKRHFILFVFVSLLLATARADAAGTYNLVFFGDSLTVGYGLDDPSDAFPGVIQKKISAENLPWHVTNAGLSGETTAGGLRRVDWILRQPADIFVLELGGNDALRGLPVDSSEANLQGIIDHVKSKSPSTKIVLAGMEAPRNLGDNYTQSFAAMYRSLAEKNHLVLIPFLLERVGGRSELNQPDGIHPTPEGHAMVAETVWKVIRPLL